VQLLRCFENAVNCSCAVTLLCFLSRTPVLLLQHVCAVSSAYVEEFLGMCSYQQGEVGVKGPLQC
jgi:hypothetical protein